jgi:hypothetical protein
MFAASKGDARFGFWKYRALRVVARFFLMEPSMTKRFGAIVAVCAIIVGGAAAPSMVANAAEVAKAPATDISAHRYYNRYHVYGRHYAYRPYYPYYYGRRYYYSPGPFFPFLPFIHGWEEPWLW